jgi:hypothetical protein
MKSIKLIERPPEEQAAMRRAIALDQIKAAAGNISEAPNADADILLEHWVDLVQSSVPAAPTAPVKRKTRAMKEAEKASEPHHDRPNSGARPATEGGGGELPDPPASEPSID